MPLLHFGIFVHQFSISISGKKMEIGLQIVAAANATIPFKRVMTAGTMQQVQTLNPGAAPQTACECALKRRIAQQGIGSEIDERIGPFCGRFAGGFARFWRLHAYLSIDSH